MNPQYDKTENEELKPSKVLAAALISSNLHPSASSFITSIQSNVKTQASTGAITHHCLDHLIVPAATTCDHEFCMETQLDSNSINK